MKKSLAAVCAAFVVFTVAFVAAGGSFDRPFWLAFLPGLIANLAILAVGIFVIDSIFRSERLDKLEQTNVGQSKVALLLGNRLAYLLLEHLGLATREEVSQDRELYFEFALERFKNTHLAVVFYEKLMNAANKEAFTEHFAGILRREAEGISNALDKIYPRPDPTIKQIVDDMSFSIGSLEALKGLFTAFEAANAQVGPENQLKPEHLDLLIKVAYERIGLELQNIQTAIVRSSEAAKANKLFISLD